MRDGSKLFVAAALALAASACTESPAPVGTGDRVVDDTHPAPSGTNPPPPPADAGDSDATVGDAAPYDARSYQPPDGYAPVSVCKMCKCPSATDYCFGGGTGMTELASCMADPNATAMKVGCNAYPAACAKNHTCQCLIDNLVAGNYPCYPVCANNGGDLYLYCPNP
jgi:hypothetical protein